MAAAGVQCRLSSQAQLPDFTSPRHNFARFREAPKVIHP